MAGPHVQLMAVVVAAAAVLQRRRAPLLQCTARLRPPAWPPARPPAQLPSPARAAERPARRAGCQGTACGNGHPAAQTGQSRRAEGGPRRGTR
eukprot:343940-Chlamydomonas_euryale.AAC.2